MSKKTSPPAVVSSKKRKGNFHQRLVRYFDPSKKNHVFYAQIKQIIVMFKYSSFVKKVRKRTNIACLMPCMKNSASMQFLMHRSFSHLVMDKKRDMLSLSDDDWPPSKEYYY